MARPFHYYLKVVAGVHVGIIAVIVLVSGWRSLFAKKPDYIMPIEFMELPAVKSVVVHDVVPGEVIEMRDPEAIPEVKPKPTRRKRKIEVSRKRVERVMEDVVRPPTDIRKALADGLKKELDRPRTDRDSIYLEKIRRALYATWSQPSLEEVGNAVAEVMVRLGKDGTVTERKLVGRSGNSAMDISVMSAVNAVKRIEGLSPAFISRRSTITISFKVE